MEHLMIWNGNRIKKVYMQFSESHETGQEHVRPIITKKEKKKTNMKYEIIFGIKENKANLYICNLNIFAL